LKEEEKLGEDNVLMDEKQWSEPYEDDGWNGNGNG